MIEDGRDYLIYKLSLLNFQKHSVNFSIYTIFQYYVTTKIELNNELIILTNK